LSWLFLLAFLGLVRFTKGAGFTDAFALVTRPFWPGSAQREWIESGDYLEKLIRLRSLENDNKRLRGLLALDQEAVTSQISAPVISRSPKGWWQKLELGKGQLHGIDIGDVVLGPGGLIGRVASITPTTARVTLLTAPNSRLGVWVPRTQKHGLLIGRGTSRPQLQFFDKDPKVLAGDVVSTSPASTLLPPNLPVGVIQSFDNRAQPVPNASVQLIASPEAIDWVKVYTR